MEDEVRRSIMIALTALLALAMAAPMVLAQAEPPEQAHGGPPADASGTVDLAPNDPTFPGTCDFPMRLEFTGKTKTIELPGGGVVFSSISTAPNLYVTITNLDNDEQATFNVTGAVLTKNPDSEGNVETVLTGRNLAIDPVAGTVITIGRYTFVFDAEGNLVQPQEGTGNRIDVCELLS
jgi:hypothetical protein